MAPGSPERETGELLLPSGVVRTVAVTAGDTEVVAELARTGGIYEPEVREFFRRVLHADDVVLDVGANLGLHTLVLADLCPSGRVIAVEPGTETRAPLADNVANAGLPNVELVATGVYSTTTEKTLYSQAGHRGGAFVAETEATDPVTESIALTTIDELVASLGIDRVSLIKLDVEGSEVHALRGARDTVRSARSVVVAECNPIALRRFQGHTAADMYRELAALSDDGRVGLLGRDGDVRELPSAAALVAALDQQGLAELVVNVNASARPVLWQRARGRLRRLIRRNRAVSRLRWMSGYEPPDVEFAHDPRIALRVTRSSFSAGSTRLRVSLANRSKHWLASSWARHPVFLSWRAVSSEDGGREGPRLAFPRCVPPGGRVSMDVEIGAEWSGTRVVLSLVQEGYTWFDQVDPANGLELDLP